MDVNDITLSFSSLKSFSKSPAHFAHYKLKEFKSSPAMKRGKLAHLLALEPEKENELHIIDVATRASKAFKTAVEEHGEDIVFTSREHLEALNLAKQIHAHPLASKLIKEAVKVEKHLFWELDGVKFHGFADVVGKDYICDVKITDSSPKKVQRTVIDFAYHMQLALYGFAEFGMKSHKSYIIACDPSAPHSVVVYELSSEMMRDGLNIARLELTMFKQFYTEWDGETIPRGYDYFEGDSIILELPNWYK